MNKIDDIKENINKRLLIIKYQNKCKKLDISKDMLTFLVERINMKEVKEILNIIDESKNKTDFKNNIVEYCKNTQYIFISYLFLFGNVTNNYRLFTNSITSDTDRKYNYDNFNNKDFTNSLQILRDNFYDYLLMDNKLKNSFLIDKDGSYNYTLDLDKELCLKIFDDTIQGNITDNNKLSLCYSIVMKYINNIVGIYGTEMIENNFDFIKYDLSNKEDLSLEERMNKYLERKNLTDSQKKKIDNINILKNKLKSINNTKSKELLDRLENIDLEKNIEELEDIYFEYENLFREDIISHLYVPSGDYTLVEDYRDLRPQLIHMFIRTPEKFRNDIENRIIEDIIKNREDKNNTNEELTAEEKEEFNKRMGLANAMLNPAIVNHSYDNSEFFYSDKNGFNYYHSDTSNQISASIYSEEYYLKCPTRSFMMGIGFNSNGLSPWSIAVSSPEYLTTNKSLTNLEYDTSREFEIMNASYTELTKNDGKSEVVLFRKGMDFETKASYVFITIDSSNKVKSEEIINKARELAESANLKLVVYDLYKINKSYEETYNLENKKTR